MKSYLLLFVFVFSNVYAQELVEIESKDNSYKFPVLKYNEFPDIEEKVNSFLQLKYLLHLPGKFKQNPFEIVTNPKKVNQVYHYESWKYLKLKKNIFGIQLNGKIASKDESFEYIQHFDLRSGDFFSFNDLFSEKGLQKIQKEITEKIKVIVNKNKLSSSEYESKPRHEFLENKLVIFLSKTRKEQLIFSYTELKPLLSDYGDNLLFPSKEILKRPDIANKLLRGQGVTNKGTKYERKLNYNILIFDISKDGKASIYRWKESLKNAEEYFEASVIDNTIQADDIIWDKRSKRKVHLMYSLHLEKSSNNDWSGKLQLGSPSYSLIFKEY